MSILNSLLLVWAALAGLTAAWAIFLYRRSDERLKDDDRELLRLTRKLEQTGERLRQSGLTAAEARDVFEKFKEPEETLIPAEELDFEMELDELMEAVQKGRRDLC